MTRVDSGPTAGPSRASRRSAEAMRPPALTAAESGQDASGVEQEAARALARAGVYRLLGGTFAYPTIGRVEEVGRMAESLAAIPPADRGLPAPLTEPLGALAQAALTADVGALEDEHVFLFDQVHCPPYEGAYGQRQLAGKSAQLADISGFYTAFGLAPSSTQPDVEDHIAAELEFMSALALKEAYALAEANGDGLAVTRDAQAVFLTDHLGRWAEAFAEAMRTATPLPYYAAAAALLSAWIRAEIERLGVSVTPLLPAAGAAETDDEDAFTCPMAPPESGRDGGETF